MQSCHLLVRPLAVLFTIFLVGSWLPAAAQESAALPSPQAEIAYILAGDLWLYSTVDDHSTRLTDQGDVRWPAWSLDGGEILYTRAISSDEMALWAYNMRDGEARLIAENACCGGYYPESGGPMGEPPGGFSFLDLSQNDLAIVYQNSDGTTRVGSEPFAYGRSLWPAGAFVWYMPGHYLAIPADIIEGSSSAGLTEVRDVLRYKTYMSNRDGAWRTLDGKCGIDTVVMNAEGTEFRSITSSEECFRDSSLGTGRAILVTNRKGEVVASLPNLANPSLAPDGMWIAAERYSPGEQDLEGVTLHHLRSDNEHFIVEGGSQPIWRPTAPIAAEASYARQPGERVIEISPPLLWREVTYRAYYYTTGNYASPSASFLSDASSDSIQAMELTGLLITRNGRPVTDPDELRQVLSMYSTGYALYGEKSVAADNREWEKALESALDDPHFLSMEPMPGLDSEQEQFAAAMRLLMTGQRALPNRYFVSTDLALKDSSNLAGAIEAINGSEGEQSRIKIAGNLSAVFDGSAFDTPMTTAQAEAFRLISHFLLIGERQRERADWLGAYADSILDGAGSLSRTQLSALGTVIMEARDSDQQVKFARIFIADSAVQSALGAVGAIPSTAVASVLYRAFPTRDIQLTSYAMTGALNHGLSMALPYEAQNGIDSVWGSLMLSSRLIELKRLFQDGKEAVQDEKPDQEDGPLGYDGTLIERYRTALLLESLADASAEDVFAEGIETALRVPESFAFVDSPAGAHPSKDPPSSQPPSAPDLVGPTPFGDQMPAPTELRIEAKRAEELAVDRYASGTAFDVWVNLAAERALSSSRFLPIVAASDVLVPAGAFSMGCSPDDTNCNDSEMPLHDVYLDAYFIDTYEVTNARYKACVDNGVCNLPNESSREVESYYGNPSWNDYPVLQPDQQSAQMFCAWEGKRLPTEAEWEKAARGSEDTRIYPWGNTRSTCSYANVWDEKSDRPCVGDVAAVGAFALDTSPYGVMDMHGNVQEWVLDTFDSYASSPVRNPVSRPENGWWGVLRGGSWHIYGYYGRNSARTLDSGWETTGFRCAYPAFEMQGY